MIQLEEKAAEALACVQKAETIMAELGHTKYSLSGMCSAAMRHDLEKEVCELLGELAAKTAEFDRLNESLAKNKRLFSNALADGIIESQLKRIKQLEDDLSLANQKMDRMKKEYP